MDPLEPSSHKTHIPQLIYPVQAYPFSIKCWRQMSSGFPVTTAVTFCCSSSSSPHLTINLSSVMRFDYYYLFLSVFYFLPLEILHGTVPWVQTDVPGRWTRSLPLSLGMPWLGRVNENNDQLKRETKNNK